MSPAAIPTVAWPSQLCLLALAPHPDDFDSVGVTLRYFHQRGATIHVAVVSGSASGVLDSFCAPADKATVREQEQRDSLRFFGLPEERLFFLRLPEDATGNPVEGPANETAIRGKLDLLKPDIVVLPHGTDSNVGHQRVFAMFERAARSRGVPLATWLFRDPKTLEFRTDLYLPFDEETAHWKRQLLLHHRSQHHRNLKQRGHGFDDRILDVNRQIAQELSCAAPYAESFQLEKIGAASAVPADNPRLRNKTGTCRT